MYSVLLYECFFVLVVDIFKIEFKFYCWFVDYFFWEKFGIIIVDMLNCYLYLMMVNGKVMCYGVGIGCVGFDWGGWVCIVMKKVWFIWMFLVEMIVC